MRKEKRQPYGSSLGVAGSDGGGGKLIRVGAFDAIVGVMAVSGFGLSKCGDKSSRGCGCDGGDEIRKDRDSDMTYLGRGVREAGAAANTDMGFFFANSEALDRQGEMRACASLDSDSQLAASLPVTPLTRRVSSR